MRDTRHYCNKQNYMTKRPVFATACIILLLTGCKDASQYPPSNMPKPRFDVRGPNGRGCSSLNGTYQYQSAEDYQFVPFGHEMRNPEGARFASIRFEHNLGLEYFFSRAMLHEDFLAVAMRMRNESPSRYIHW